MRQNAAHLSLKITAVVQFLVRSGTSNIHLKGLKIDEKLTSTDVHCYGIVKLTQFVNDEKGGKMNYASFTNIHIPYKDHNIPTLQHSMFL